MATVLATVEVPVGIRATKLLINNRWVDSESGKTFPTINPATGEEICQYPKPTLATSKRPCGLRERPSTVVRGDGCRQPREENCCTGSPT